MYFLKKLLGDINQGRKKRAGTVEGEIEARAQGSKCAERSPTTRVQVAGPRLREVR